MTATIPAIGHQVRIYDRSIVNGRVTGRVLQPDVFVIVRQNRHGDWTVRHEPSGTTHDVFRADVVPACVRCGSVIADPKDCPTDGTALCAECGDWG